MIASKSTGHRCWEENASLYKGVGRGGPDRCVLSDWAAPEPYPSALPPLKGEPTAASLHAKAAKRQFLGKLVWRFQHRRGPGNGQVGPLPLRLHSQVSPNFLDSAIQPHQSLPGDIGRVRGAFRARYAEV